MSFVSNLINNISTKFKSKYGTEEAVKRSTYAVETSLKEIAVQTVKKTNSFTTESSICEYDNCDTKLRKKNIFNSKVYCNKHFKIVKSNFNKESKVKCTHIFGQNSSNPGQRCPAQAIDGKFCNRHKPKRNEQKQEQQRVKKEKPKVQEPEEGEFDFDSNSIDIYSKQNSKFWRMISVDVKLNGSIETLGYHKITGLLIEEEEDGDDYEYILRGQKLGSTILPRSQLSRDIVSWCKNSNITV